MTGKANTKVTKEKQKATKVFVTLPFTFLTLVFAFPWSAKDTQLIYRPIDKHGLAIDITLIHRTEFPTVV